MREPTEDELRRLDNAFNHHAPKGGQAAQYEFLRGEAKALATQYLRHCPPGHECSLAITMLEQAMFWANAAIARAEPASPS